MCSTGPNTGTIDTENGNALRNAPAVDRGTPWASASSAHVFSFGKYNFREFLFENSKEIVVSASA